MSNGGSNAVTAMPGKSRIRESAGVFLSLGLRGVALLAKFGLLIYISRYIGLAELGVYGLIMAATVVGGKVMSLGLYFVANRDMVGSAPLRQAAILRDQQIVYFLTYAATAALLMCGWPLLAPEHRHYLVYFIVLLIINHQVVELFQAIIALHRQLAANFVMFLNSAWGFAVIAVGILWPSFRTLEVVLDIWIIGTALAGVVALVILSPLPFAQALRVRPDWPWIGQSIRRSFPLYLALLGQQGAMYVDRYVVTWFEGVEIAGVLVMFWSFGNAVQVLIQAGVLQTAYPKMIQHYKSNDEPAFWAQVRDLVTKITAAGAFFCVIAAAAILPVLEIVDRPLARDYVGVFWFMLVAFLIKFVADALYYALYARHRDRELVIANVSGLVLSGLANIALVALLGIWGAVAAQTITAIYLVVMQAWYLRATRTQHASGAIPGDLGPPA
ncbi:MAG: hypothetical protein GC131_05675 [Alphaproteobacteria bacterium]|nr:hypothetical protein [Alphaproteobacteria bacterium]